ncbi:hypothetical protein [Arthrobacter cupressi]|uniref:Uncharacterized protein n=1 Tax=Arthrobacter cupressi TaxID=1045773 RepID=A0A1G8Y5M2_9MICC|nr:hypothetical protein [Arthrobacter cupressi]NYD77078.1 diadenosine tetraphosphate (Ap4A) HIT family hydrolase [Arthrobacter cupressi]SDJ97694.1 hypothetical protein SAMN05216555_12225 [Arthrobacter cupressi]
MPMARRLLLRSSIWEVARPRVPLTAGHFMVRLSDPAAPFTEESAADWLLCYSAARAALDEVLRSTLCTVMFPFRWHPLGSAIGEPAAESSTPGFHLFARWPGESTTPGSQLALPAHRRRAEGPFDELDATLRAALQRAAAAHAAAPGPDAFRDATWVRRPDNAPGQGGAAPHHVLVPEPDVGAVSQLPPSSLLALASALEALPTGDGVTGFSCVMTEGAGPGRRLELHALGRAAGEERNPLETLRNLPEVSRALL